VCLAVPGKIVTLCDDDPLMRVGRVDFGGVVRDVHLAYTPEARIGDFVLVHVGFAISVIDDDQAQRIFDQLHALETDDDQEPGPGDISHEVSR